MHVAEATFKPKFFHFDTRVDVELQQCLDDRRASGIELIIQ